MTGVSTSHPVTHGTGLKTCSVLQEEDSKNKKNQISHDICNCKLFKRKHQKNNHFSMPRTEVLLARNIQHREKHDREVDFSANLGYR